MEDLVLADYLSILWRRKKLFLAVGGLVLLAALAFALNWSNYRSRATVEVAQPELSGALIADGDGNPIAALESMADLRISRLKQKVLATGSLIDVVTKFDLYPGRRKNAPIAAVADHMRKDIKIALVGSALANPASAQKASAGQLAAIAFTLSFDYGDPRLARQVTNELVSRFLDEDLKERRTRARETAAFLDLQLKALEKSLAEQEKKIADFHAAHGDVRPDMLAFNQQTATATAMRLQNLDSRIESNLGAQGALRAQLALVDPYSRVVDDGKVLTTPSAQLKALKSEYATLSARYGPEHPDVLRVGRQVAALEMRGVRSHDTGPLRAKITDIRARLAAARKEFGADHPDVRSLKSQMGRLEQQLARAASAPGRPSGGIKADADNPAYLQIVAQLRAAQEQYKALISQKDLLQAQQEKFQSAVAQNPGVEQQLAALTRDYDNTRLRYRQMKEKKMTADMSREIEQDRSGPRLQVIDPPDLPADTRPRRVLLVLGGLILSVGMGLVSVLAAQILFGGVVGARHLEALAGVAPLVTIPYLAVAGEKLRLSRRAAAWVKSLPGLSSFFLAEKTGTHGQA